MPPSMAGETIMSVAYGLEVQQENDIYIRTAEEGVHPLTAAGVPGAFLVDTLPFLKNIPEWMPGAAFQKKAREWKKLARNMVELPFEAAKKNIVCPIVLPLSDCYKLINCQIQAAGESPPCFASISLQKMDTGTQDDAYREDIIQGTAGTMYAGA